MEDRRLDRTKQRLTSTISMAMYAILVPYKSLTVTELTAWRSCCVNVG